MTETSIFICGYRPEALKQAQKIFKNFTVIDFKPRKPSQSQSKFSYLPFEFIENQVDKFLDSESILIPTTEKGVLLKSLLLQKIGRAEESHFLSRFIDKGIMKDHCTKNKILITDYILSDNTTPEEVANNFQFPIYMKKRISSGSRQQRFATNTAELQAYWQSDMLLERNITGEELSIESFVFNKKIYFSNITTYHKHHTSNIAPGLFSDIDQKRILEFNEKIIQTFKVDKGFIHVECFLQKDQIVFGEIAIRPPGGFLMKLIEKSYGFEPWSEYFHLFLNKPPQVQTQSRGFSSVWILHPGEGRVKDIWGLDEIIKDKNLVKYKIKFKKGDRLTARRGSGESYGYFLFHSPHRQSVLKSLENIETHLQILLEPNPSF